MARSECLQLSVCGATSQPDHGTLLLQVALVIYAPRKSVCDVYASRHGPLLATLQCGPSCRCAHHHWQPCSLGFLLQLARICRLLLTALARAALIPG